MSQSSRQTGSRLPADRPLETSPSVGDDVAYTTCYMCACRCGIKVHLQDGEIRYIQGNRDHPVNKGVLCAKGSAGIMQVNAPSRLRAPLKRVGPRGSGEFEEITWDEAMEIAVSWLKPLRETDPEKLAFFTGRDQSQSFTGLWAQNYGTPNFAAHGGFCSVNMAAGGIYTMGGAFWEFGQPDWDHTKLLMIFGVAEDHDSGTDTGHDEPVSPEVDIRTAEQVEIPPADVAVAPESVARAPELAGGIFAIVAGGALLFLLIWAIRRRF